MKVGPLKYEKVEICCSCINQEATCTLLVRGYLLAGLVALHSNSPSPRPNHLKFHEASPPIHSLTLESLRKAPGKRYLNLVQTHWNQRMDTDKVGAIAQKRPSFYSSCHWTLHVVRDGVDKISLLN